MGFAPLNPSYRNTTTEIPLQKYYYRNTITEILLQKYYYRNTITEILLQKYYYRNTTGILLGDIAAVDDELGAGDERGFVGGEEQHPPGDLDRLADAWAFSPWALSRGAAASARSCRRAPRHWSRSASAACSPDASC